MPKKPEAYGSWLKLDKPEHIVGFLLKSLHHTLRQSMEEALRKKGVDLSLAHFGAPRRTAGSSAARIPTAAVPTAGR